MSPDDPGICRERGGGGGVEEGGGGGGGGGGKGEKRGEGGQREYLAPKSVQLPAHHSGLDS